MESSLHENLKEAVFNELRKEGDEVMIILVECETKPRIGNMKIKTLKIRKSFTIQKQLSEKHILRLLLVIPPGMLHKVSGNILRRLWEIWIVNNTGKVIHKIPQLMS